MTQKSRKIRAIAAGGAVLGVGAAITLAAWSDSEFAQGIFNTQDFGIVAATDGETFDEHATGDAALELVPSDLPETMVPGQTLAYEYQIRNIDGGADSSVTYFGDAVDNDMGELLTTNVMLIPNGATCDENTSEPALPTGEAGAFPLTGSENADAQRLCIHVTLAEGDNPDDAQVSNIAWRFDAEQLEESTEPESEV